MIKLITFLLQAMAVNCILDCKNTNYCGILTLESGFGLGPYKHQGPIVHGLWNDIPPYGTSKALSNCSETIELPEVPCYTDKQFQAHEWKKHGIYATVDCDPLNFFNQVCILSSAPLRIMNNSSTFEQMQLNIRNKFPNNIFNINAENKQIELMVCADDKGTWKLTTTKTLEQGC